MPQKKSAPRPRKKAPSRSASPRNNSGYRVTGGLVCLVIGLFTLLGYFIQDYWLIDGLCLYVFKGLLGYGFYIVCPALLWIAGLLLIRRKPRVSRKVTAVALMPFCLGCLLHLILCKDHYGFDWNSLRSLYLSGLNVESGGVICGVVALVLRSAVSDTGAIPVLILGFLVCIVLATDFSLRRSLDDLKARLAERQMTMDEVEECPEQPAEAPKPRRTVPRTVPPTEIYEVPEPVQQTEPKRRKRVIDIPIDDTPATEPASTEGESLPEEPIPDMPTGWLYRGSKDPLPDPARVKNTAPPVAGADEFARTLEEETRTDAFSAHFTSADDTGKAEPVKVEPVKPVSNTYARPKLTEADVDEATGDIARTIEEAAKPEGYEFPPIDILRPSSGVMADGREEIAMNRERLETTLHSFGIGASICGTTRGPTVTRYDLELEAGVKLNKLTNLAGDLALSLGVASVRIAPIPDKISTVGVEVPNKVVSTVFLRDILESSNFKNAPSKLSFAIGKDIGGNCIVGNISKLPHMLIAGTTGSGKSVCMNSLILSLLYKATPEEVRLIMIDPKMVELGIYNGIPHLYIPVVTDPKKAAGSLQWAVVEMMKRYRLFSEVGVRDLKGYNSYREKLGEEALPNVVIVIDELADLMMTAAKEVEESICRVAQMGRAAGMHLIIATQRPSADVITGLMKANIPSRIAFAVSSSLESRIILDNQGAEKLIGMGDMLYAPLGCGKPLRVQGAFVSDEEREDVINFIKDGSTANYDDEILHHIERAAAKDKDGPSDEYDDESDEGGATDNPFADCDELLPQAVDVILDTKQASVSMLQRRLKLGYSRAARLVDQMEELGIVGPFEGSKPRQLLITREQWQEMSMSGRTPMERLIEEQKDDFSEDQNL